MQTRIIRTRFYEDSKVQDLSYEAQNFFMYLLTCKYINISGIFELTDRTILFEHKVSKDKLQKVKEELQSLDLVRFSNNWIYVTKAEKNNNYRSSPKNESAYQREISLIPELTKTVLLQASDSSTNTTMDSNPKSEIINNKSETINQKKKEKVIYDFEWLVKRGEDELRLEEEFKSYVIGDSVKDMIDWIKSKGKQQGYKDFRAFAKLWIRKNIKDAKLKRITPSWESPLPQIDPDAKSRDLTKLHELKVKMFGNRTRV